MAWGNVEQLGTEQRIIDRFHEQNPDVRVKLFRTPGSAYRNKMIVMLASRTAPDVIRVDQYDFPMLVRRNYFRDITEFAQNDAEWNLADHFPQANEECVYNGRIYGVNTLFGGTIMYYNRTMVQKAGLEDPYRLSKAGRWTWDRFREHAIAMTKTSGGRATQFGFQIPGFVNYTPLLWAHGASILSDDRKTCLLDSPEAIEAYTFLLNLRWKDRCCPTPAQAAQSAFVFESGRLGMTLDWMGMSPRYRQVATDFEWDVCPVPSGKLGGATLVKGNQLIMNRETRHAEAAWRFMRHVTSAETERYICGELRRAGTTRPSVAADPEFLKTTLPPKQTDVFVDTIPGGRRLPIDQRWHEWSTIRDRHLERLLNGTERNVGMVLRQLAAEVTAVLRDEEGF
jgi:multiple sugar transport system substrate-binding protein